ncbi:hypothetical protein IFM89_019225 [Coptis chinensis]|uniref:Uncharacterized protein n=1 Tax=Coptis chinensis TaxID=261450 RepID=A0A835MIN4_9MAGN|nr:hypothetical protein IFM89_019225 [Coptis chinensis]
MAGNQKEVVKTRSPQIRWYPNMESILIEVLLEELATGGKMADNVRSRLKTMRLAWQVAKHAVEASGFDVILIGILWDDECYLIFGNDYATGEGGNSGFDDDMVDGDDFRQTQGDRGDDSDAGESSAFGAPSDASGDTSQTESGPRSTTPTAKKTRKSRFFEDILEPPLFKVLTEAVAKIAEALKSEPREEEVDQIDLLKDALQSLPDMNLKLFLRSLDWSRMIGLLRSSWAIKRISRFHGCLGG